jgi:hypothetical protein
MSRHCNLQNLQAQRQECDRERENDERQSHPGLAFRECKNLSVLERDWNVRRSPELNSASRPCKLE